MHGASLRNVPQATEKLVTRVLLVLLGTKSLGLYFHSLFNELNFLFNAFVKITKPLGFQYVRSGAGFFGNGDDFPIF